MKCPQSVILTALLLLPALAQAQPLVPLLGAPEDAAAYDYCAWQHKQGADTTGLATVQLTYDDEGSFTAAERAAAALIDAGVASAQASKNHKACVKAFDKGKKDYDKQYAKEYTKLKKRDKFEPSKDAAIAEVQQKISTLWAEDQARRRAYSRFSQQRKPGTELWRSALSRAYGVLIDVESTTYMKTVLDQYDWVDSHRFGERISAHAWLLVQHADRDPAFQVLALDRMTPYLDNDGVSKSNYAYLFDRVAVNHDRKQRYGTQPIWECTDEGLHLAPLEEPDTVNERRATMGMGPVEESLAEMTRAVCGK
ncbi:MAG: DUF6624 domain-containing protein [Bacteroidota bacterium]